MPGFNNPLLDRLRALGDEHENNYLQHLRASELDVAEIAGKGVDSDALQATKLSMQQGRDVIAQAALASDRWNGRADVLLKVDKPSDLGGWSYEAVDTKLSQNTKGNTVLQLCLYSDLLGRAQGLEPAQFHVVVPFSDYELETYRFTEYAAYYRQALRATEGATETIAPQEPPYPDPCSHCEICRWQRDCDQKRRQDDHLCLVAGISKGQINRLNENNIVTVQGFSELDDLSTLDLKTAQHEAIASLQIQASEQIKSRGAETPTHWLRPVEENRGLARLPEPDDGDVFFDFEGDQWLGEDGLEFLFGYWFQDDGGSCVQRADWALNRDEEKATLEAFMAFLNKRRETHPDFHIYHFGHYEPSAFKRLVGRYATCGVELDDLLREERFVDLFTVVRQGLVAGVESYSIKQLEPLYGFERQAALKDANQALNALYLNSQLGRVGNVDDETKTNIAEYNADDCRSTQALRDWLESQRADLIGSGSDIARPTIETKNENKARDADEETQVLVDALLDGVSEDPEARSEIDHGKYLLAHLLTWHRREEKVDSWEYYRLADLPPKELVDEMPGIAGLSLIGQIDKTKTGLPIHRYTFLPQDTDIRKKDELHSEKKIKIGECVGISREDSFLDIRKRGDSKNKHPNAVFRNKRFGHVKQKEVLKQIALEVIEKGFSNSCLHQCAHDLLLCRPPRLADSLDVPIDTVTFGNAQAVALDRSTLAVQGPPGTGKSYTGARMICELVKQGKRVGVTANSHEVVVNLLKATIEAGSEEGVNIRCQRYRRDHKGIVDDIAFADSEAKMFLNIEGGDFNVFGGTTFVWSKEGCEKKLDVLIVDEAGQMSLANVLAASQAAKSLILLGDPQQLDQPTKASHPDGVGHSALQHLIGENKTLSSEQGLFLEETYRLPPSICGYISELFYDDKLQPIEGCRNQSIIGENPFGSHGLRYVPVTHSGNKNASTEEAAAVEMIYNQLISAKLSWRDREGKIKPLLPADILIIAPYNAQVHAIKSLLPEEARVGTVDKFQGQEAPVTIYSMATSSYADAPRGMEFLYSANRLNVAVSRAQCLSVLVASPALFEPTCYTPRQIQLANGLCRFLEVAETITQTSFNS